MKKLKDIYRHTYNNCSNRVSGHQQISMKQSLQNLTDATGFDEEADLYGTGRLIESFEREVANLLGMESAVFLPSGTMAQPIALRIWSDLQRTPYVGLHATSHLNLHEHNGYQILYNLKGVNVGLPTKVPNLDDLKNAARDPLAAILLELPMREIGGQLPSWEDLVTQCQWAQSQNIKMHLDGARLWQCRATLGKEFAEIAALFDSVYVSFYKDVGGISGAALAGSADFVSRVKIWQRRTGGNLFALYPYVIAAREGLKTHLPQMSKRLRHARWLADKFNALDGFETWPLVPHTNMFRMRIHQNSEDFLAKSVEFMQKNNLGIVPTPYEMSEGLCKSEITIGNSFDRLSCLDWETWLSKFATYVGPLQR